ncbi:MAG: preprotein translocase subunit SecA [Litorivicinaceae bacterium]
MTQSAQLSGLDRIRARALVSTAPSVWWEDGLDGLPPSLGLRVLDAHRRITEPGLFDRLGLGVVAFVSKLQPKLPRFKRLARRIRAQSERLAPLDAEAFAAHLQMARLQVAAHRQIDRPEITTAEEAGLAAVAAAVFRVHGFYPHVEQLIGVIGLLEGRMMEMATGEGKTITATMAAVMAAWRGLPCHVVTANDYLASRDAELADALCFLCGVTVSSCVGDLQPPARQAAYQHDVVYTTAKDLLADYLRDDLALGGRAYRVRAALAKARKRAGGEAGLVMQGMYQVIVDEADSILIDEAVTPLIISEKRPDPLLEAAAVQAITLADQLKEHIDFDVRPALKVVELTEAGKAMIAQLCQDMDAFWRRADRAEELVQMALYATHILKEGQHFVVEEGQVVLIDELTGRFARQRTLSLGMQQVLDARMGLAVSAPAEVKARLSFQRFFTRFQRLGGMTGTAQEAKAELAKSYGLSTVAVPTHRPVRRKQYPLVMSLTEQDKFTRIVRDAQRWVGRGRAVLIGVRSVRASEALKAQFDQQAPALRVSVLSAVNDAEESMIVANAGQVGAGTIATNMAGRGTDIKPAPDVLAAGGLHVMIAESNDYARIDRQLLGRSARQGDPGSYQRYVSLDEELLRRFLPKGLKAITRGICASGLPGGTGMAKMAIQIAQARAAKLAFKQRRSTVKADRESEESGL